MGKLPLRGSRQKPNNKSNTSYKSKLGVVGGAVHKNNNNNSNNNGGINKKKSKAASLKNQIRSTQRLLQRDLPAELREAQENKLEELKKQQLEQNRLAEERKIFLRDRKIKFFERRKIERRIRRMEKQQRVSLNEDEEKKITEELVQLKKDLEYVRFFPKAEKYVPLFCGDDQELVDNRNRLRLQIKANIIAAAASGKDLEETGSEDDGPTDLTDDDFFVSGSSSDEADADDELTDLSAREQSSSAPAKAVEMYQMPKDGMIQKQTSARSLMPPPRPQKSSSQRFDGSTSRNTSKNRKISHSTTSGSRHSQAGPSSSRNSETEFPSRSNNGGFRHAQVGQGSNRSSTSDFNRNSKDGGFRHGQAGHSGNRGFNSDTYRQTNGQGFQNRQVSQNSNRNSNSITFRHSNDEGIPNAQASQSSNISSNSDAPKKPRKRRPKKKKQ